MFKIIEESGSFYWAEFGSNGEEVRRGSDFRTREEAEVDQTKYQHDTIEKGGLPSESSNASPNQGTPIAEDLKDNSNENGSGGLPE